MRLVIAGEPKGKARPRFSFKSGRAYTPKDTEQYERKIISEYRKAYGKEILFGKDEPIRMDIYAFYKVPTSESKAKRQKKLDGEIMPTKKPDWDNVAKIVADALNGVAYYDDAQIVVGAVSKHYASDPRIEISIRRYGGDT